MKWYGGDKEEIKERNNEREGIQERNSLGLGLALSKNVEIYAIDFYVLWFSFLYHTT